MTPDDRQAVDLCIDDALTLPSDQWEPLITARFESRPDLAAEARSLLAHAHGASIRFPATEDHPLPQRAGPYRLIRELGRGGMGVVYLAERDDGRFEQRVAVKLLPPIWGLPGSSRRFEAECRILARLEHPRICRILDSGHTAEGWPFLTMELVDGQTLDCWSEATAATEIQKLHVFLQICDAVRYAHTNLVIHRDLKPQNVVITAGGDAKLLDFGVAKLLSADVVAAQVTVPMLTPKYASPEQLAGGDATTASDVFALGVMLRELAGPRPPGDLEAIVGKAAARDSSERYGSVAQLAEDITRYLERAPVLAKRQTFGYVASRLFRRYRRESAFGAAAALAVAAGVAGVMWQARVAATERARALQHSTNIRRLAGSLVFDLHDRIERIPGALDAREALLARGTEYLDILARDAGSDIGLLIEVAQAYTRLSLLQFEPVRPNRSDLDGAAASLEKAELAARTAIQLAPRSRDAQMELLRVLVLRASRTAIRATWRRTPVVKLDLAEEALALAGRLARESPDDAEVIGNLGAAQFSLAATYEGLDPQRAIDVYRAALASTRQVLDLRPDEPASTESVARAARALGVAFVGAHQFDAAIEPLQEALALDESLLARSPNDSTRTLTVTFDLSSLFSAAQGKGDWDQMVPLATRITRMREEIVQRDPADQGARLRLWFAYTNVGADAFVAVRRFKDALESLSLARALEPGLSSSRIPVAWMGRARYNEAVARDHSNDHAAACALFHEAKALYAAAPATPQIENNVHQIQESLRRCGGNGAAK